MIFLGELLVILGGCQFVLSGLKRRRLVGLGARGKTDSGEPLSTRECAGYIIVGLAMVALGLNYVIRHWR
jgi:hypothetical protein